MYLRDLDRLRRKLSVAAEGRVRLVMECAPTGVSAGLECVLCEELLGWDSGEKWWVCSQCGQEVTEKEGVKLLQVCRDYLDEIVSEKAGDEDEGKGPGRWWRVARAILSR